MLVRYRRPLPAIGISVCVLAVFSAVAAANVAPASLSFGDIKTTHHELKSFTVTNTSGGSETVDFGAIRSTQTPAPGVPTTGFSVGRFVEQPGCHGGTIGAGATITCTIGYFAARAGTSTGTLNVYEQPLDENGNPVGPEIRSPVQLTAAAVARLADLDVQVALGDKFEKPLAGHWATFRYPPGIEHDIVVKVTNHGPDPWPDGPVLIEAEHVKFSGVPEGCEYSGAEGGESANERGAGTLVCELKNFAGGESKEYKVTFQVDPHVYPHETKPPGIRIVAPGANGGIKGDLEDTKVVNNIFQLTFPRHRG